MLENLVDTVQLEVEQFPDPQPAGTLQPQRGRRQRPPDTGVVNPPAVPPPDPSLQMPRDTIRIGNPPR